MFRSESNITLLVLLLMVVAKSIASGFCGLFVEPAFREEAPNSFDALSCCAGALIGNNIDFKACVA